MPNNSKCTTSTDPVRIYGYRIIISILLSIIFMVLKRKKGRWCLTKTRLDYCCGCIVPVKFLEDKHNRLPVLATFSLIAKDVYILTFVFSIQDFFFATEHYQKILCKIILVQMLSLIYLPLLVASTTSKSTTIKSFIIHLLGFIYSVFFFVTDFLSYFPWCPASIDESIDDLTGAVFFTINISGCTILIIDFLHKIYVRIFRSSRMKNESPKGIPHYHWKYVLRLLKHPSKRTFITRASWKDKFRNVIKNYVYWNIPGFRYSITILVSTYVGVITVLLITVSYYSTVFTNYFKAKQIVLSILKTVNIKPTASATPVVLFLASQLFNSNPERMARIMAIQISWFDLAEDVVKLAFIGCIVCITLAFLLTLVTVLHMLKHYRRGVIDLARQIRNEHLLNLTGTSNITIMVSATQFAGYQVAHLIWGFHLQLFVFCTVSLIAGLIIFIPLHFAFKEFIMVIVECIGPFMLVLMLTIVIQYTLIKFFYAQERGKVLALDNRRDFYNAMYFMFFFNTFCGFVTCLVRILKSVAFSICFLARLDRSFFPRTFEEFDTGFHSYACLLNLEARQSNSIVVTFVGLLSHKESFKKYRNFTKSETFRRLSTAINNNRDHVIQLEKLERNRTACNKWFLAWTLMHNRDLILLRKPKRKRSLFNAIQ